VPAPFILNWQYDVGNLFRVGTEYSRTELYVKKKNVPYLVASCMGGRMRKKAMTRALGTDHGQSPEVKAEKRNSGRRVCEEEL
jgi:hypothetical protein